MFDINLINNPGVQGSDNIHDDEDVPLDDSNDTTNSNVDIDKPINKNKKYFFIFIVLILLSMSAVYFYNYSDIIKSSTEQQQSFLLIDIINILDNSQEDISISLMAFKEEQLLIEFKCINEESFYRLFDSFSNIIKYNIKGYHIQNNYALYVTLPWEINNNKSFNIDLLNKELIDLGMDLKQEIYKNKLIIVSSLDKIIKLVNLITELNLINNFSIEIKQVQSLPNSVDLYQVIVE